MFKGVHTTSHKSTRWASEIGFKTQPQPFADETKPLIASLAVMLDATRYVDRRVKIRTETQSRMPVGIKSSDSATSSPAFSPTAEPFY